MVGLGRVGTQRCGKAFKELQRDRACYLLIMSNNKFIQIEYNIFRRFKQKNVAPGAKEKLTHIHIPTIPTSTNVKPPGDRIYQLKICHRSVYRTYVY